MRIVTRLASTGIVTLGMAVATGLLAPSATAEDQKNDSASKATQTIEINASGTVSLSVSAAVETSASIIVAGVKASGTAGATRSLTVGGRYAVSVTARPHTTAYAESGIWRVVTRGSYFHRNSVCQESRHSATARTPYRIGGHVWGG